MSLEVASSAFLEGYRLALEGKEEIKALVRGLLDLAPMSRPFAFEGGAMGCRLLDQRDGGRRTERFSSDADEKWGPLVRLGVGCALARLKIDPGDDPLTLDGYGFQVGLITGIAAPGEPTRSPHSERGRGRALWFVTGGRADACAQAIHGVPSADALWQGVGTACAFAGDPLSWASGLLEVAHGFENEVKRGVYEAVELWCALEGVPPGRTIDVERAILEEGESPHVKG